jgi:multidrug efflux pump subunit AcrB
LVRILGPDYSYANPAHGELTASPYDGLTPREARDFAETARAEFLHSPDVGKVDIFGDQDEKIYLHFAP